VETEEFLAKMRAQLVRSFARGGGSAADLAEDVAQETIVRLLAKYPDIASRPDAIPLAYGFARNVQLEFWRRQSRHSPLGDEAVNIPAHRPDGPTQEQLERCFAAALPKLPRSFKGLGQAMLNGRKNLDLAEVLGINLNALYQRQNNCRKALKEIMWATPECEGVCHA
jgi:DNA-directed RNA polymerase specialized sigma24 family protein